MSRYRPMNGEDSPVVICEDDVPGTVFAMAGRQQDVELIAAALNLAEAAKAYYREFDHLVGEHDYPERRDLRDALISFSEADCAALTSRETDQPKEDR